MSFDLSYHSSGQVLGSLLIATDLPLFIIGSFWKKPNRGSKRIILPVIGLIACLSRKPVSIMYAGFPLIVETFARTNGVVPSL